MDRKKAIEVLDWIVQNALDFMKLDMEGHKEVLEAEEYIRKNLK